MPALFIVKLYDIRIKEQGAFTSTDCLVKSRTFSLMSTNVWGKANWTLKIQLVSYYFYAPSTRIRIRLYPQTFCCGFKSLRVHTYPDSLRFRPSTRICENDTNPIQTSELYIYGRLTPAQKV